MTEVPCAHEYEARWYAELLKRWRTLSPATYYVRVRLYPARIIVNGKDEFQGVARLTALMGSLPSGVPFMDLVRERTGSIL